MIYKRRHPEITKYNRILKAIFEEFERNYQNKISSAKKAHYEVFEFMALLAGHLPSPYETITYYYGIYSSSYRGKERKEKRGIPLSEIQHFRSAQRRNIPDHPSRQEIYQKIKKRLPEICLYKPIPRCYRFV